MSVIKHSALSKAQTKDLALVKLDGTLVKKDGSEKPSSYFDFLKIDLEDYDHIAFTPEEAARVKRQMQSLSTGSTAALPMTCPGVSLCVWSGTCPYVKIDRERKLQKQIQEDFDLQRIDGMDGRLTEPRQPLTSITPVGRPCLVEVQLLLEWTELYITEYDINPQNFTEFQMARELAEIELLLRRLNANLAKPENAELVQENVVGFDKGTNNPITKKEVSSIFEARERLQTRKSRLVKLLVGDRQEKYKREAALKQKQEADPSVSAARLRASIARLIDQAKNLDKLEKGSEIDVTPVEPREIEENLSPEDLIANLGKEGE